MLRDAFQRCSPPRAWPETAGCAVGVPDPTGLCPAAAEAENRTNMRAPGLTPQPSGEFLAHRHCPGDSAPGQYAHAYGVVLWMQDVASMAFARHQREERSCGIGVGCEVLGAHHPCPDAERRLEARRATPGTATVRQHAVGDDLGALRARCRHECRKGMERWKVRLSAHMVQPREHFLLMGSQGVHASRYVAAVGGGHIPSSPSVRVVRTSTRLWGGSPRVRASHTVDGPHRRPATRRIATGGEEQPARAGTGAHRRGRRRHGCGGRGGRPTLSRGGGAGRGPWSPV